MERIIGTVGVDAGLLWIGDPCYVLGEDASHGVKEWSEFCDKLNHSEDVQEPLGDGIGLAVATLYGDGTYPVYGTYNARGELTGFRVDFDPNDMDEESDDWGHRYEDED